MIKYFFVILSCIVLNVSFVFASDAHHGSINPPSNSGEQCKLASVSKGNIQVFCTSGIHIILAKGYRESDQLVPQIEALPITIYPPQFRIVLCGEPGPRKMTPYVISKAVNLSKCEEQLVIHTAEGPQTVQVQELPPMFEGGPWIAKSAIGVEPSMKEDNIVIGISASMSFDEAFQEALMKLLERGTDVADDILRTKVLAIESVNGGFPGYHFLAVKVLGIWDSEQANE